MVSDGAGEPVPDAMIEIWQGDLFGRCRTDPEGLFHFTLVRPPAGYYNVMLFARGLLRHLHTRLYFPGVQDDLLESLARRHQTVVAREEDGGKLRFDIRLQGEGETVFFDLDDERRG